MVLSQMGSSNAEIQKVADRANISVIFFQGSAKFLDHLRTDKNRNHKHCAVRNALQ